MSQCEDPDREVVTVTVTVESSSPYGHLTERQLAALLARYRPEYRDAYREVFGRGARARDAHD